LHLPACWVVTSHFPPRRCCPFSGSQRGKSHPSYHQTLKAHICSPLPHSPVRPFDPFDPFTYRIREVVVISGQTHSPSDILHHLARAQLATVACLLPPRKSECRVIYHGAQASTQIEQPGRGIRFPNTTVADRTVAAPGTWRCIPVWTVHAALVGRVGGCLVSGSVLVSGPPPFQLASSPCFRPPPQSSSWYCTLTSILTMSRESRHSVIAFRSFESSIVV
jgi:hypothetical protein